MLRMTTRMLLAPLANVVFGAVLLLAHSAQAFVAGPCISNLVLRGSSRQDVCAGARMQLDPFAANLVIGGIAGTVSNLAVFPIDLVKTRLQSSSAGDGGEGALAMIQYVIRADGVAGLWAGSTPVLLGSAPESALQLAVQTWLITSAMAGLSVGSENDLTLLTQIICGGVAGASTILVTNPMETLRIRASIEGKTSSFTDNVRALGLSGLYFGFEAGLARDIPFSALYFPLFCTFKAHAQPFFSEGVALTIAALVAGMFTAAATSPFDIIKTRVQAQAGRTAAPVSQSVTLRSPAFVAAYSGAREGLEFPEMDVEEVLGGGDMTSSVSIEATVRELVVSEGWWCLFKGVGPRTMRLAPCMAITLVLYEQLQQVFRSVN